MENEEKFVCLGDCLTCQALLEERVDPILCPTRILMGRTSRLEKSLNSIIELIQSQQMIDSKPKYEAILVKEEIL